MKRKLAMVLAVLLSLSMMSAQAEPGGGRTPEKPEEAVENELTVGTTTALSGSFFTEMWGNNTSDADVRGLLHGYNLMRWNGAEGSYEIDDTVVSGLVVTENGAGDRTYTIVLYDDLKYSDGRAITAKDYAFSMLLSVSPEVAAIGGATNGSDYIVGAAEYKSGETSVLSGVRVQSDRQLSVTVSGEYLPYFYEQALLDYHPYPIHEIAPGCEVADDGAGVYIRNADGSEPPIFTAELLAETILDAETGYRTHPEVVSGPYELEAFDWESRTATFVINEEYKGNSEGEKPEIERLTLKTVSNETMMEALSNGEVGLLNKCVNAAALDAGLALVAQGEAGVSNYARSGYSFISYCCEQETVQSAAVRQAIAHCFDKDAFVSEYVRNYGMRVDGYYGIGQWMYQMVAGSLNAPEEAPGAEASAEELAAYEAEQAAWAELTLEGVKQYALDLSAAEALLEGDGWTLNREGGAYEAGTEEVRCKQIGEKIVPLELEMIYPEGNAIGEYAAGEFAENLAAVGIGLQVEAKPFAELLELYYRQEVRECELIYLATNFAYVYEPSKTFAVADAYQGTDNRSGIQDEKLYELAVEMRKTEPGDVLAYCEKWVAFQEYYAEVLPTLPVYSNVYFDFYTPQLQDYYVNADVGWAEAIVGARLSAEVVEEEMEQEEEIEFVD